jgi:hypothetical protein
VKQWDNGTKGQRCYSAVKRWEDIDRTSAGEEAGKMDGEQRDKNKKLQRTVR